MVVYALFSSTVPLVQDTDTMERGKVDHELNPPSWTFYIYLDCEMVKKKIGRKKNGEKEKAK